MSRACVFPPAPERRTRGRRGAAAGTVPRPPRVPRIPVIYPKRGELPPLRRAPWSLSGGTVDAIRHATACELLVVEPKLPPEFLDTDDGTTSGGST